MNVHKLKTDLQNASNVLVLAPLTPDGNQAHLELLTSTPEENTAISAVTYTQPPDQWFVDWEQTVGSLSPVTQFIYANGMAQSETYNEQIPDDVNIVIADPTDPMEIIVPLSNHLKTWTEDDKQPIVSVQTLTVLLEYVDFDTTFRYLHILTHRIQAAGAVGYFQIDPDIHDPETINTLKTLFDTVVEISESGAEWTTTSASSRSETTTTDQPVENDTEAKSSSDGLQSSIRTMLSGLFSRNKDDIAVEQEAELKPNVSDETTKTESQEPVGELVDEEMLTDEERIRSILIEYGGRMKQVDITAETSWSKSTVSRKLSKMEENNEIKRVQVGRGNLVFLNGSEPEASKSPFEV
ncbi:helix-turn-helix transcriptional regulator [Haladaptatus pallidirubidus]|uniref:DUF7343 domain-containing protein n=1 Tax=Haladaptatus pallidirubidus TaxID=1008152 RepID=A0AAV3UH90_9EURY|nr:MarR family transcriptional regulator [Haladaptatus pallidirubidus]